MVTGSGSSKDAGKKAFVISRIEAQPIVDSILAFVQSSWDTAQRWRDRTELNGTRVHHRSHFATTAQHVSARAITCGPRTSAWGPGHGGVSNGVCVLRERHWRNERDREQELRSESPHWTLVLNKLIVKPFLYF